MINRDGYTIITYDMLNSLAKNKNLTKMDYRLIFILLTILDDKKFISLSQKDISERLGGFNKTSVSLSFKNLVKNGVLDAFGAAKAYRFNEDDPSDSMNVLDRIDKLNPEDRQMVLSFIDEILNEE